MYLKPTLRQIVAKQQALGSADIAKTGEKPIEQLTSTPIKSLDPSVAIRLIAFRFKAT